MDEGVARRIIAAIKEQIHAGAYRPGDKLPSTRAFAAEWGVSRTTVTAAYGQFIAEGYLVTRPGARAVVAEGLADRSDAEQARRTRSPAPLRLRAALARFARARSSQAARIADFRYGDLAGFGFPRPRLAARVERGHASGAGAATLRRSPGLAALRAALKAISGVPVASAARRSNRRRQRLAAGARSLRAAAARSRRPFVIENPGYVLARHAFAGRRRGCRSVPVDGDGIRTDKLPSARLAYVTPSHQFPLGASCRRARRRAPGLGRPHGRLHRRGRLRRRVPSRHRADPALADTRRRDAVIYVGTLSKTLSPTLRLGYLVVPAALRRAFGEAKRLTDRHTPLPEQEALPISWRAAPTNVTSAASADETRSVGRCCFRRWRTNSARRSPSRALKQDCMSSSGSTASPPTRARVVEAARSAGVGLYPVSPLYDPAEPGRRQAGFILG